MENKWWNERYKGNEDYYWIMKKKIGEKEEGRWEERERKGGE